MQSSALRGAARQGFINEHRMFHVLPDLRDAGLPARAVVYLGVAMRTETEVREMLTLCKAETAAAADNAYTSAFAKCLDLLEHGYTLQQLREIGHRLGIGGHRRLH